MDQRNKHSKSYNWRSSNGEKILGNFNVDYKIQTKSGTLVRTKPEMRIANYLYMHGIKFIYEPKLNIGHKTFYPDFYIPSINVYIEFFGWSHIPSYKERLQRKIDMYSKHHIQCIYLYLKGSRYLEIKLENELRNYIDI